MSALDYAIVLAYVAAMLGLGALVSRRITSFREYFIAAGRMTAPLLLCTLVSSYYGLDVLFGGSEVGYQEGIVGFFGYTRPYYVAILVAALVVARRLKTFDVLSLPDVMARFYGDASRAVAALASAVYALPMMAIMGIGLLLDAVVGIPFAWGVVLGAGIALAYTLMGGLVAGALTDTIQFVLMCVTLGVAAVLTMEAVGGVDGMRAALPESYFVPTGTYPAWVLVVFAASALSVLVEPAIYQRVFAAIDYRAVVVALLLGIGLWAAFDWIVTLLGMAAAAQGIDTEPRYALLTLVLDLLPVGLKGLFVAGVLATAMSTIDSYLLIAGGNLAYDLYRPLFRPGMSDRDVLRLTRWMIAASAAASIVFALFFQSMVSAWIFMSAVLVAAVLVPLMIALYAPWPPRPAAGLLSAVAGLATLLAVFGAVHLFGEFDADWHTQIWRVELRGRSLEVWQEYAVLFALPAAVAGYAAGYLLPRRWTDRFARPTPAPAAARAETTGEGGPR